jgi:hypothetical protein
MPGFRLEKNWGFHHADEAEFSSATRAAAIMGVMHPLSGVEAVRPIYISRGRIPWRLGRGGRF